MKTIILLVISVLFLSNVAKIKKLDYQACIKNNSTELKKEVSEKNRISFRTPIIIVKRD